MMGKHLSQLRDCIVKAKEGDTTPGMDLSHTLHDFEEDGGHLSDLEDALWTELTMLILGRLDVKRAQRP